jgi:hypothetical protein
MGKSGAVPRLHFVGARTRIFLVGRPVRIVDSFTLVRHDRGMTQFDRSLLRIPKAPLLPIATAGADVAVTVASLSPKTPAIESGLGDKLDHRTAVYVAFSRPGHHIRPVAGERVACVPPLALKVCLCAPGEAGAIQPMEVRSGKEVALAR